MTFDKYCGMLVAMDTKRKIGRPKKIIQPEYVASLTLNGETQKVSGSSVLEVLRKLQKPVKIVNDGVFEITDGKRRMMRRYMGFQVKRLFYPVAQPFVAKQIEFLMK